MTLRPTAERYQNYVPEEVRDSLRNALDNLHAPVVFANDLLQGQPWRAETVAGRFLINSTLGLGGLFDVASRHDLSAHDEDFGGAQGLLHVPAARPDHDQLVLRAQRSRQRGP